VEEAAADGLAGRDRRAGRHGNRSCVLFALIGVVWAEPNPVIILPDSYAMVFSRAMSNFPYPILSFEALYFRNSHSNRPWNTNPARWLLPCGDSGKRRHDEP
jgi:hypothetical protein